MIRAEEALVPKPLGFLGHDGSSAWYGEELVTIAMIGIPAVATRSLLQTNGTWKSSKGCANRMQSGSGCLGWSMRRSNALNPLNA
ncbi:MAG: hypothetical protein PUF51_03500 [Bifidobacteriaceae bacterium]|nr:hypothetical protein [Bifidobacteriaceae bacterium]